MPASSRLPLAVIALLLLSLSFPTATAMGKGNNHYSDGGGGRVVAVGTIHGRGTGVAAATGAAPSSSKWQQRRLEEAVAPEFGSVLAAAGQAGYISYDTLNKNRQSCGGRCAAQGASYTRPCYYSDGCRG